jgi:hypothetical protein
VLFRSLRGVSLQVMFIVRMGGNSETPLCLEKQVLEQSSAEFTNLPPGQYVVEATKDGYQAANPSRFTVSGREPVRLEIAMKKRIQ